jgi:hypothetical protein
MRASRPSRTLAALLLAWFVAFLAAGVLAPKAQARPLALVCTGAGLQLLGDDGTPAQPAAKLDCPLCIELTTPPPVPVVAAAPVFEPRSEAPALSPHRRPPRVAAAPLPARGPPHD